MPVHAQEKRGEFWTGNTSKTSAGLFGTVLRFTQTTSSKVGGLDGDPQLIFVNSETQITD